MSHFFTGKSRFSRDQFVKWCRDKRQREDFTPQLLSRLTKTKNNFKPPVIWLGTNTCSGDHLSLLNSLDPGYQKMIEDLIDFRFSYLLMAAEGERATRCLYQVMDEAPGQYILIVEGSIATRSNGLYSVMGRKKNGQPLTSLQTVQELGAKAKYVVAAGTCASFGGPYSAAPNPSQSKPVQAILERPVINVPGCPIHPDWLMGTLAHLVWYGIPELDAYHRPTMFYGQTIHELCERRPYFEEGVFSKQLGEPWCMYKLGCKGPVTYADCPRRQWSGDPISWPVKANTPCIGCTSPEFPDDDMPFFEHLPDFQWPGIRLSAKELGRAAGLISALGIGTHLAGNIVTGRLSRNLRKGFKDQKHGTLMRLQGLLKNKRKG
ncbi:hydrogenase small subunit [Desulforamulus ruminis]|uniref:Hydrogenase (NiFe) small subunit HydA n=1 Tax=Desulforamulus ruminis (strain ATCC 23193 / DSM 2154 / NCIMB 8452 / DL) TaxID=696281 RepID=F6DME7_DESRL|nr:hydrogenase small subunit [Desulforamulus ruminis]AEG60614.1 hydrogenase (NiFe) small subunit HydA [Desulforamulus ruminis DSM 2154]